MAIPRGEEARRLIAELESLLETYEIMADEELMSKIHRSEEDIAQGRYITLEALRAEFSA